jgi:molecular chaperone DnaK
MIIGIDLGTTNSAAAFLENDEPKIIPNDRGNRLTPSIVALTSTEELLVGEAAKNQSMVNPKGTIISVKRKMGEGKKIPLGSRFFLPEEISAEILKKIKRDAEDYVGEDIHEAVITVPAYFTDPQRRKTKEAGALAGLRVSRIINEPTAAALAYASSCRNRRSIMVYDLGGGTFDVTVLASDGEHFEVLATAGDNKLGGIDFDQLIFRNVVKSFSTTAGIDFTKDAVICRQLMEQCERAKIELSSREQAGIALPFIAGGASAPLHLEYSMTRDDLEKLILPHIEKTIELCRRAINDSGRKPDTLILSGGSSRIPVVRKLLHELTGLNPESRINPEEVVAMGAAVHAGQVEQGKRSVFRDVTPLPLGVEIEGGDFITILKKNSKLPAAGKQLFTTISDLQRSVEVHVLQGNSRRAEENTSLGRFLLGGIKKGNRGEPLIEVNFKVDEDGILHAQAKDVVTGAIQQVSMSRDFKQESDKGSHFSMERLILRVEKEMQKAKGAVEASFKSEIMEIISGARKASIGGSEVDRNSFRIALETIAGELEAIVREQEIRYG